MADVVCAQNFFRRKVTKPILQVTVQYRRRMVNSQFPNIALNFTQTPNYYLRQNPIDLWSSAEPKHDWSAESSALGSMLKFKSYRQNSSKVLRGY